MKILCFGEQTDLLVSMSKFLESEGFSLSVSGGKSSLNDIVTKIIPDVILIDSSLKSISPLQLIQSIKENEALKLSPIFLLIEETKINDLPEHIQTGVDEIILKPFDLRYLSTRVTLFHRMFIAKDNNPLTGLPGNKNIAVKLQNSITNQYSIKFAVIYCDLDQFKPYNDIYGFAKGDDVLLHTAKIMKEAIEKHGNQKNDFLGHIGGDDFLIISTPEKINPLCSYIITEFDKTVKAFYTAADRRQGFIRAKDRDGVEKDFAIISISLAVVTNLSRAYSSISELSSVAAEVKKSAKSMKKSSFIIDKRSGKSSEEASYFEKNGIERRSASDQKKASILIVDDSLLIIEFLKTLLTYEGYEVDAENLPEKAIFKANIKKYDLIITDISMPKIDGFTLINAIRKTKYGENTPFAIISAYNKREIIIQAKKAGVKRFFVKPFDKKDFLKGIETILEEKK